MADIVLLDRIDTPVTYTGVERIKLPTASGGTQIFEPEFRMDSVYYYLAKPVPTGNGDFDYQIVGSSFEAGGTNGNAVMVTAGGCESNGYYNGTDYVLVVVASKKQLTKGNTYTDSEIYYG